MPQDAVRAGRSSRAAIRIPLDDTSHIAVACAFGRRPIVVSRPLEDPRVKRGLPAPRRLARIRPRPAHRARRAGRRHRGRQPLQRPADQRGPRRAPEHVRQPGRHRHRERGQLPAAPGGEDAPGGRVPGPGRGGGQARPVRAARRGRPHGRARRARNPQPARHHRRVRQHAPGASRHAEGRGPPLPQDHRQRGAPPGGRSSRASWTSRARPRRCCARAPWSR